MKYLIYIASLVFLISCSGENSWNCFQATGDIEERVFTVGEFSKIRIEGEMSLVLKQGSEDHVRVSSGENLFGDIEVRIEGETLVIADNNKCNLVRDYGISTAYVTANNLTEIRNSSSFNVESEGVLNFPELFLISDTSGGIEDVRKGGDFRLSVQTDRLRVRANGQSAFYINGKATRSDLRFTDEFPRFEGAELEIERLEIFQVSANKMIVHPLIEITGEIRGTGDVISVNRPPNVDVEEFSIGRLIFED